jgi:hypothetical protein
VKFKVGDLVGIQYDLGNNWDRRLGIVVSLESLTYSYVKVYISKYKRVLNIQEIELVRLTDEI